MKTLLCLALSVSAWGQVVRFSATTGDTVLSAAGTKFTIQQPASNAKQVNLEAVTVYCSVACDFTQAVNGTAATTTAGTVTSLLPYIGKTMNVTAFTASNVGAGTASGGIVHIAGGAGTERTIDLSKISFGATGTSTNYTFVISSITGTVNITVVGSEKQ